MKSSFRIVIISFLFLSAKLSATNELSVKDKNNHGEKPGYIENATLVIEPHGSFVEHSLYLEYSERSQFFSHLLEIVHRFELPYDAAVNDMWLWIGDSVMQAEMYDTWSARSVYDSIVAARYDPAFLTKTGSQYELRVYPLAAGGTRKVKISYIVPTLWHGGNATTELPLELLLSNNSISKPLEILFRTKEDLWGKPKILEAPEFDFVYLTDSLDYDYQRLQIDDIPNFTSLNLTFNTNFSSGYFVDGFRDTSSSTYFQFGISPKQFFNVKTDSTSQDVLVALDLSGSFKKNLSKNLPIYKSLVESSLKPNDNFQLTISGDGKIVEFTNSFLPASSENINTVFQDFSNHGLAVSISNTITPKILFCDRDASTGWNYNKLDSVAIVKEFGSIKSAISDIPRSDVVAAYRHGFDDAIDQIYANRIILRLDSLFAFGGRFLTYYDYNREHREKLATNYISGLKVKKRTSSALTLYRNVDGNIGVDFPESFTRNASYFFEYNDPDVKIELMDEFGDPAVISKKINEGIIIVTGIWSLKDDAAMKTLLGAPLLGINSNRNSFLLDDLLTVIKNKNDSTNFSKVVLLSDSDSLVNINDSKLFIQDYIADFNNKLPAFMTVNILDNNEFTPSYISEDQQEYYGSGYFLKELANQSNGMHVEKHLYDWYYIRSLFSPFSIPNILDLNIDISVDDGVGEIIEFREVNNFPDPNQPRFFLGKSDADLKMDFAISAKFEGFDSTRTGNFEFLIPRDSVNSYNIISAMLGNEKINDLFRVAPIDTSEIVRLSLFHNLLTDYTALLALEPDDSLKFLADPSDESAITAIDEFNPELDSTIISAYPNPFNNLVTFQVELKSDSRISAKIYNSLGQEVAVVTDAIHSSGIIKLFWNAKNKDGNEVSSGFYIFRAVITNKKTNEAEIFTNKIVYLK
ncbi:MAG: T9SS type A sorting domain-containing protein [Melioribacteraceae bacterium]|nr:T9SS type A sorting domain-containing protein [Melioribacteraceae bacterium]MCF8264460.1 T9SS type A sorting domain-containing protein [Melioribacteraceae bacterium]